MNTFEGSNHMKIDRSALEKLMGLDDKTLIDTINSLADAAGLDKKTVLGVTGNLDALRQGLSKVSDKDISSAVNMLGEERTAEVLNKIKEGGNG